MKKTLALLLALVMVFALVACGQTATPPPATEPPAPPTGEPTGEPTMPPAPPVIENADDIPDEVESPDGTYKLAFVTDVGQLKDKSFNQGTWNGVKRYAYDNGLTYKYYQPAGGDQATDDDRYDAMKAAVDNGAEVVTAAGFMQGGALEKIAAEYPDVMFVFIDGWPLGLDNVAPIAFKEEQCGYFAGYAVVKEGFTKLGFSGGGGGTNPACCRYGYGFAQGASAAAAEMGVDVALNYSWEYGATFSASPELQTMINGWYENGTEIVFACGGSMFASIAAAAAENDAFVVGVDSDQSFDSDTVVTSALKGVGEAAAWAIAKFYDGAWADVGNVPVSLGVENDAVGLPTETWSLENFSVEDFDVLFQKVLSGALVVDPEYPEDMTTTGLPNITINVI